MKLPTPLRKGRYPNPLRAVEPPALAAVTPPRPDTAISKALRNALLAREGKTSFKRRGQGR
jgi:hypothetical protein